MGLAPLKAVKRGAQSTPGSAWPRSPPPLSCEEGELSHEEGGQETRRKTPHPSEKEAGTPRPQEPEGTVLALRAIPPSGDASQEGQGQGHPGQAEVGRAEVALSVVPPEWSHGKGPTRPEAPAREGGGSMAWS